MLDTALVRIPCFEYTSNQRKAQNRVTVDYELGRLLFCQKDLEGAKEHLRLVASGSCFKNLHDKILQNLLNFPMQHCTSLYHIIVGNIHENFDEGSLHSCFKL